MLKSQSRVTWQKMILWCGVILAHASAMETARADGDPPAAFASIRELYEATTTAAGDRVSDNLTHYATITDQAVLETKQAVINALTATRISALQLNVSAQSIGLTYSPRYRTLTIELRVPHSIQQLTLNPNGTVHIWSLRSERVGGLVRQLFQEFSDSINRGGPLATLNPTMDHFLGSPLIRRRVIEAISEVLPNEFTSESTTVKWFRLNTADEYHYEVIHKGLHVLNLHQDGRIFPGFDLHQTGIPITQSIVAASDPLSEWSGFPPAVILRIDSEYFRQLREMMPRDIQGERPRALYVAICALLADRELGIVTASTQELGRSRSLDVIQFDPNMSDISFGTLSLSLKSGRTITIPLDSGHLRANLLNQPAGWLFGDPSAVHEESRGGGLYAMITHQLGVANPCALPFQKSQ